MSKIKKYFNDLNEMEDKLKLINYIKYSKIKSIGISLLITLFFLLPFFFMIYNLLYLGNYGIIKCLGIIIVIILILVPNFVYYDVLKHYNKEVSEIDLKPNRILWLVLTIVLVLVLIIVI